MNRWSTPRHQRARQTRNRPHNANLFRSEELSFYNQGETSPHNSSNQYRRGYVPGWWHLRITVGLLHPTAHTAANQRVPLPGQILGRQSRRGYSRLAYSHRLKSQRRYQEAKRRFRDAIVRISNSGQKLVEHAAPTAFLFFCRYWRKQLLGDGSGEFKRTEVKETSTCVMPLRRHTTRADSRSGERAATSAMTDWAEKDAA